MYSPITPRVRTHVSVVLFTNHWLLLGPTRLWKRLTPLAIYSAITTKRGGANVCIVLGK